MCGGARAACPIREPAVLDGEGDGVRWCRYTCGLYSCDELHCTQTHRPTPGGAAFILQLMLHLMLNPTLHLMLHLMQAGEGPRAPQLRDSP